MPDDRCLVAEARLAPRSVAGAGIAGANQLGIVQSPYHPDTTTVGDLRDNWGELGVDIVQVEHIGLEVIQQCSKFLLHLAIAEGARERSHLGHVPWPVLAPGTLQVLGIVHRKDGHLVAVLLKQLLQVEHIDAVATATIIELVGEKDFQNKSLKYAKIEILIISLYRLKCDPSLSFAHKTHFLKHNQSTLFPD